MNNTLRHIVYNIRTLIKDRHSDDLQFTDRNIAYWVKYLRAKLIRQGIDRGNSISDNLKQELSVDFESIDTGSSLGVETGSREIKSSTKIPKFISSKNKDLLTSITSPVDDSFIVTIQPKAKAIRNHNNKYGRKYPVAYLDNGYLYIKGCNFYIENLDVTGVFQDPEEAARFNNPELTSDEFMDEDYPIEDHMIDMINSIVKSNELNLYFQIPSDKVNDAQTSSM